MSHVVSFRWCSVAALLVLVGACGDPNVQGLPDGGQPPAADLAGAGSPDLALAPTVLRVHYPAGAHTVTVRGDTPPLSWTTGLPMTQMASEGDVWELRLPPGLTGNIQWKPLLDDQTWSRGANYSAPAGTVSGAWPHFFTEKGRVDVLFDSFASTLLGNSRRVWVYLPPSYDENPAATYPVLYMHDGQNLFDPALAFGGNEWMVDETLDSGAESLDKPIAEIIVVAPENAGAARIDEYTPSYDSGEMAGGKGPLYLRMLVEELKPQVDQRLRTRPGPESTGLMGSSLGGLISAYGGLWHADQFGMLGIMSPSTWWNNAALIGDVTHMAAAPRPQRVYVDCGSPLTTGGTDPDDWSDTMNLVGAFGQIGYPEGDTFFHVYDPGAPHNETSWARRLPAALGFLFGAH